MEESLSWQAQLAKANINITGVQYTFNHKACVVCFEFPYHPKPGQVKWLKTAQEYFKTDTDEKEIQKIIDGEKEFPMVYLYDLVPAIKKTVLSLRKELEG